MRKLISATAAVAMLLSLNACSTYRGTDSVVLSSSASTFALIPFDNQSNTPMAAENVQNIVSSELVARNIKYVSFENTQEPEDLKSILDDNFIKKQAKEWLENANYNYVISGCVDEWNYKAGLDGEPVVSITIQISDANGNVVYKKTGSRSGFGRESLNGAGQSVVENILSDVSFN